MSNMTENMPMHPLYTSFFSQLGVTSAMVFTAIGASYGTAKSGTAIASIAVFRPDLVMKAILPIIMAGLLAIFGLVVAIMVSGQIAPGIESYRLFDGFRHLASGLICGLCGLGAGWAMGQCGDTSVRALAQQPKVFLGMLLILIFAEILGLYGFIISILVASSHD